MHAHPKWAGGVTIPQLDISLEQLLPILQPDWFGITRIGGAGIKRSRKRRVGIHAVHAVVDDNILARPDMIEIEVALKSLKTPETGAGVGVLSYPIKFHGRQLERFSVGTKHGSANVSCWQGVNVIFITGAVGYLEWRQAPGESLLRKHHSYGQVRGEAIFAGMYVVRKPIDSSRAGAGGEAVVPRTRSLRRDIGEEDRRDRRAELEREGFGAPQHSEDRSDALAFTHRAQLRKHGPAIGGGASAVADRGEKSPFNFLLRENNVLITLLEAIATVAIVAAGKNVDITCVGAGKVLVNMKTVARDGCGRSRGWSGFLRSGS